MDFKKMECFTILYEEKSFTKAADRMYMAQSSLSGQIKSLEEELNTVLINRNNKRDVSFTEAGNLFYEYCHSTLNGYNHMRNQLLSLSVKPIKNIGLFYSSRLEMWTQKISLHNEIDENDKYGIVFSYGKEKFNQIIKGETFINLSIRNPELEKMGFTFVHRHYDQQALGVPYNHPLAKKDEVTVEDLKDITINSIASKRTKADEPIVETLINKYGLKPYNFKYHNRIGDLHFCMKTDNAVIMMPSDLMPETCKVIKLNFDPVFKMEYGWYYKTMNDDVKWVIENL